MGQRMWRAGSPQVSPYVCKRDGWRLLSLQFKVCPCWPSAGDNRALSMHAAAAAGALEMGRASGVRTASLRASLCARLLHSRREKRDWERKADFLETYRQPLTNLLVCPSGHLQILLTSQRDFQALPLATEMRLDH